MPVHARGPDPEEWLLRAGGAGGAGDAGGAGGLSSAGEVSSAAGAASASSAAGAASASSAGGVSSAGAGDDARGSEPAAVTTWQDGSWRQHANAPQAPAPAQAPAPLEWEPRRSLLQRLGHALTAPARVGVFVFLAVVAVVIVVSVVTSRGSETVVEASGEPLTTADADARATPGPAAPGSTPATAGEGLLVHVVGAVSAPGVVEIPTGSRVADALSAAGGATAEAGLAGINLARPIVDGEQLVVPTLAELAAGGPPPGAAPGEGAPAPGAPGAAGGGDGTLSLNAASAAELESLPRIGPALAGRIVSWRDTNGPFVSVDDLLDVPGIGVKTLDGFRDQVRP